MKTLIPMILLSFLIQPLHAFAQQAATVIDSNATSVKIEPVESLTDLGIPFLTWSKGTYLMEKKKKENVVEITGAFSAKVLNASINGKTLVVNPKGEFKYVLKFTGDTKAFIVSAMDEAKKTWRMNYKIVPEDSNKMVLKVGDFVDENAIIPKWRYSFGVGYTLISFRDFQDIILKQDTLTIKGGVVYRAIDSVLDFGLSGFYNVAALNSTSTGATAIPGEKLRYLGLNARATYHVIDAPSNIRFNVSGGFYWNSSIGRLGFSDMIGPQIYPDLTYVFANGNSLYFYTKYAASISNARGLSFKTNREVATGLHYSFPVSKLNRMTVGADVSQLSLDINDAWASTNTYSLSTGISF
jgi:hypothetical protein